MSLKGLKLLKKLLLRKIQLVNQMCGVLKDKTIIDKII